MFNETAILKVIDLLRNSSDDDVLKFVDSLKSLVGCVDSEEVFDNLPGFIKLQDESVAIIGEFDENSIVYTADTAVNRTVSLYLPNIKQRISYPQRPTVEYTPLYDTYLVKRNDFVSKTPMNIVTLGKFFHVGRPREKGLPRFPAIATKLIDGKHIQIHKSGNIIKVFDRNGEVLESNNAALSRILLDLWRMNDPENVVFNAIFDKEKIHIIDLLLYNDDKRAYLLPYYKRIAIVSKLNLPQNMAFIDHIAVENEEDIQEKLSFGRWMLKWREEKVNISRPHWYIKNIKNTIENNDIIDSLFERDYGEEAYKCRFSNGNIFIEHLNLTLPMYTDVDELNVEFESQIVFGVQSLDAHGVSSHEFFLIGEQQGRYVYMSTGKIVKCPTDMPYILWINEKFDRLNLNISHIDTLASIGWESIPYNYESIIEEKEDLYS